MKQIFENKTLLILVVVTAFIGIGIGLILSLNIFESQSTQLIGAGDRLMLANGESLIGGGAGKLPVLRVKDQVWEQNQPITLTEARNLRWKIETKCTPNIGYYSRRTAANDLPEPYSLIFDSLERVVGVYIYSENEQQPPWGYREATGPYPYPHWGLHLFFVDSTNACN